MISYYTVRQILERRDGPISEFWWNGKESRSYNVAARSWKTRKAAECQAQKAANAHVVFQTYIDAHDQTGHVVKSTRIQ